MIASSSIEAKAQAEKLEKYLESSNKKWDANNKSGEGTESFKQILENFTHFDRNFDQIKLKNFLKKFNIDINIKTNSNFSTLITLIKNIKDKEDYSYFKSLIYKGLKITDRDESTNENLLQIAIKNKNLEMVEFLMDFKILSSVKFDYEKPHLLFYAAEANDSGLMNIVPKKFQKQLGSDIIFIKHLFQKNYLANLVNKNIIKQLVENNDIDNIKYLITSINIKFMPELKDASGKNILFYAVKSGKLEITKLICDKFSENNNGKFNTLDILGNNILYYAAKGTNYTILKYLLKFESVITTKNKEGEIISQSISKIDVFNKNEEGISALDMIIKNDTFKENDDFYSLIKKIVDTITNEDIKSSYIVNQDEIA